MNNKSIAIITARGGSKRIPKKNIKDFCGKPIIAYSIEAAVSSGIFDEVMVSTDSREIAEIAQNYGANVPFLRSEKTSDDYATTRDVLVEVFSEYAKRDCYFDVAVCIYPTAPFVTAEKLIDAVGMLDDDVTQVIPVVKYSFPPQRAYVIRDEVLEYQFPENARKRSQDLEPIYHDCGQFYVMRPGDIIEGKKGKERPIIMPESEVQDIDNEEDWKIAEIKYKLMVGM